eukprot:11815991-Alexandrium_andersonii.AAC.1
MEGARVAVLDANPGVGVVERPGGYGRVREAGAQQGGTLGFAMTRGRRGPRTLARVFALMPT